MERKSVVCFVQKIDLFIELFSFNVYSSHVTFFISVHCIALLREIIFCYAKIQLFLRLTRICRNLKMTHIYKPVTCCLRVPDLL